jgi:CDP-diacylglycerol--serine O-phosphatidyltransferase
MIIKKIKQVIPFLFTFANALFGFLSIIKTIEGNFIEAALCIIAAALMDALDGRLARMLNVTGELGGELDSLCDAVSFCLAPTVLLYSWYLHNFNHVGLFMIPLGIYLCAGLFRLARFNVTTQDQHIFFFGLPTTIAAFFFAELILYDSLVSDAVLSSLLTEQVVAGILASVAFLMISSLRFPAFKKSATKGITTAKIVRLALLFVAVAFCFYNGYPIVLMFLVSYIVGGVLFNGFTHAKKVIKNRQV